MQDSRKRRGVSSQPRRRRVRLVRALSQVTGGAGGRECPLGMGSKGRSRMQSCVWGGYSQLARRHRRAPGACRGQLQRAQNRSGAAEHRVVHGGTWTVQQRRRRNGCRSERGRGCGGRCEDERQGAQ